VGLFHMQMSGHIYICVCVVLVFCVFFFQLFPVEWGIFVES